MKHAADALDALGVAWEAKVVSAHRTPQRLFEFATGAKAAGYKVIIAGAGGAAHLPGMAASMTDPAGAGRAGAVQGAERPRYLLSIVQMPGGVPVGTLAIGEAGAKNAGLLAAQILALSDEALAQRLAAFRGRPDRQRRRKRRGLMSPAPPAFPWPPAPPSASSAADSWAACWPWPPPRLGFDVVILDPEENSPAGRVSPAARSSAPMTTAGP